MIVIALVAILSSLAAPSFKTFVAGQRVKTTSFDFYSSLTLARSEAIKRRASVQVAASASGWSGGWEVKSGSTVLFSQGPLNGVNLSPSPNAALVFSMDGRLTDPSVVVTIESQSEPDSVGRRCLNFDATGAPRSFKLTGSGATCS
jgi:type IV fimbrial biogenesis protein FimT